MKEDIAACPGLENLSLELAHMTVIILIKARLISKAQEIAIKGETTLQKLLKDSGKPIGQVKPAFQAIKSHLALLSDLELKEQIALLDKYLGKLLSKNPTLLKAVINPDPLMSRGPPKYFTVGSPEEAFTVLHYSLHLFRANPMLMAKILQLVGPKPNYPTETDF